MKKFTVPVTLTINGIISIEATNIQDALEKARKLNIEGVEYTSVEGQYEWIEADESSEVEYRLIEEDE